MFAGWTCSVDSSTSTTAPPRDRIRVSDPPGDLPPEGPAREDLVDLRRVLYDLDAILRLHMAQEEELYVSLGDEAGETGVAAGAAA